MAEVNSNSDSILYPALLLDCSINDTNFRMNNTVRENYCKYLTNILNANANDHNINFSEVQHYAQQIELWALRKCMNVEVYREEMLKGIEAMKRCNEIGAPFTYLTIDDCSGTIDMIKKNPNIDDNDTGSMNYFSDGDTPKQLNETTNSPEMPSAIFKEENFVPAPSTSSNIITLTDLEAAGTSTAQTIDDVTHLNVDALTFDPIYQELEKMFTDDNTAISSSSSTNSDDSAFSKNKYIWQCEYTIQKSSFLQQMYAIYVMNPEKYKRINRNLRTIFGSNTDSDDDSDKEVTAKDLVKSLKMKAASLIKLCLMPFYNSNRIKTTEVYKKVARALSNRIIEYDPHISIKSVRKAVCFCFHKKFNHIDETNVDKCIKRILRAIENNSSI